MSNSVYTDEDFKTLLRRVEALEKKAMTKIVRKIMAPSGLQKIQMSQQTQQYSISLRNYLPSKEHIKAVLLSVALNHGNTPNGHAYLSFEAYQEDCELNQKTYFTELTFNAYYTVHKQEIIIPWNTDEQHGSNNLIIDIIGSFNTETYSTQGNQNFFQIQLSGYII